MQGAADFLQTHTFAVQSNHFVVPVNPALPAILTDLLRPGLGISITVSLRRRRFGNHRHNRFRQRSAFLLQKPRTRRLNRPALRI